MQLARYLLVFTALWSVLPLAAQSRQLLPEGLGTTVVPRVQARTLFNGADGFFFVIPEEAVRVEVALTTAPPEANLDLFIRAGEDVERAPSGEILSDFRSTNSGGQESIVITEGSIPALAAGTYFIAIEAGFGNPQTFAFLDLEIELTAGAQNLDTIAATDFEARSTEDWTRNFPAPELIAPGSTTGSPDSKLELLRGPFDFTRNLQLTSEGNDYFVAPPEFLGKIGLLGPNARLEFDLAYNGDDLPDQPVEVRILGELSTYRWTGVKPERRMNRVIVQFEPSRWERLSGGASFDEVLGNVLRIEIRGNYGSNGGITFLDNIVLLGKATTPGTPAISTFDADKEGWKPNVPEAPFLIPRAVGVTQGDFRTAQNGIIRLATAGNPGGFLQVRDLDDRERDYLVAPDRFLGNLLELGSEARIEFDRNHASPNGPNRGVELRLIGFGGAYAFVGPPPGRDWTHYVAPLRPENWVLLAGDRPFNEVLRAVQRIEISMDELTGAEESGLDNFAIVVPPPLIPELSAAPDSLRFNAVQGAPIPDAKPLELVSNGPLIEWIAAASSGAPWIRIDQTSGTTPATIEVTADPTGLPVGVSRGFVEIAWIGSARTVSIPVVLNLVSATGPLISEGGVVNAATFRANADPGGEIAGGMFVAVFGSRLASRTLRAATVPLPNELAGTTMTIGGIPSALVFVSDQQIVGVAPQGLTQTQGPAQSLSAADVIIIHDGEASPAERIRLTALRPLLFSQNQAGTGAAAALNAISSTQVQLNTFDDPARPTQVVSLFGTGFGPTQIPILDGFAATGANPVTGSVRATLGGRNATIQFAGLSPQSPHLYQVNITIPADAEIGCEVPIRVAVDGVESNEVTLSISRNGEPCR